MSAADNSSPPEPDFDHIRALFHRVLACSPAERQVLLDTECANNDALRHEVQALVDAAEHADDFLPEGGASSALIEAVKDTATFYDGLGIWTGAGLSPGVRLGAFEVIEEVGRGGMGTVYRARRADGAFYQEVALKVVNRGADTEMVVRRFLRERELLSSLAHPNIARLLDGGESEDGRPFFVMEFVEGQSITAYAEAQRLPLVARLHLMVQACRAVAFAHRRLVVHRDLKPSNILVYRDDAGKPVVKLLDFGIARILTDDRDDILTIEGPSPLTPGYAAPEQINGEAITTATDVYALGAVLFEMLVGRRVDPKAKTQRPSTALLQHTRDAEPTADAHDSAPKHLARQLRGDLDSIVMKALRSEPEARYASADDLADDLERYLRHEPVVARRGSARYYAVKFVRRNKWGVAASGALALMLVVFSMLLWTSQRAALEARDEAQAEARKAHLIAGVLEGVFFEVDGSEGGFDVRLRDVIENSLVRIETLDEPLVQAHLLDVLARVFRADASFERSEQLHQRAIALRRDALGEAHPLTLEAQHHYAYLLMRMARTDEAEHLMHQVLRARRDAAEPDPLLESLSDYAHLLRRKGRLDEADRLIEEALALLAVHPDAGTGHFRGGGARAGVALQRGQIRLEQGDLTEAARWVLQARNGFATHFGDEHSYTATSNITLGRILGRQGRHAEARDLFTRAGSVLAAAYGEDHPTTQTARAAMAEISIEH